MIIKDKDLEFSLVAREAIGEKTLIRLFDLMDSNYHKMDMEQFLADFSQKQWVGLIKNQIGEILGFTTFAVNPKDCGTSEYHIIFSGDTILDPTHWGSQIVMKGWCFTVGQLIATNPAVDWYWYLMSKGHRTYMYLPLFFNDYYPSINGSVQQEKYQRIADEVSSRLYPENWHRDKGLIYFPNDKGALSSSHAQATFSKAKNKHIAFFLEKNPHFYNGDELVCIAPINKENFIRTAKEFVDLGYHYPIEIP